MAEHSPNKAQELGTGDDLHAVVLRTCVVTPKNKKAYTEFEVLVFESGSSWLIRRRYRQFHALNEHLKNNWGTIVPKNFPPKALKKNLSPYIIDRRHQLLQNWLFLVVHNKSISRDKKLRLFLTADALSANSIQGDDTESATTDPVSPMNTSIEAMGFLYQFKEGVCKRRWFVLRTGMLYKYHYPKEKHPYRQYELKEAIAAVANLKNLDDTKISSKKGVTTKALDRSNNNLSPPSSPRDSKVSSPRKSLGQRNTFEEDEYSIRSSISEGSRTPSLAPAYRVVTAKPVVESVLDWKNAFCVECGKKTPLVFIAETEVDRDCWVIAFNKQQEDKALSAVSLEALRRFTLNTSSPRPISVKFDTTVVKINSYDTQFEEKEFVHQDSVKSIESTSGLFKRNLEDIQECNDMGIPNVVAQIMDYLLVTCEGAELSLPHDSTSIKLAIESGQTVDFESVDNPSALIDVILEWLNELPSPLFPVEFYDCLFATFNIPSSDSRLNVQRAIMKELPKANRAILGKIFQSLSIILARNTYNEIVPLMFARYILRPNSLHEQSGMALYVVKEMIVNHEIFQDLLTIPSVTSKRRLQLMHSLQKNSKSLRLSSDLKDIRTQIREVIGEQGLPSWKKQARKSAKLDDSSALPTISQLEAEFKDWTFEDSSDGEEGAEFSVDESERVRKNMAVIMASKSNISRSTTAFSNITRTDTEDFDEDIDDS